MINFENPGVEEGDFPILGMTEESKLNGGNQQPSAAYLVVQASESFRDEPEADLSDKNSITFCAILMNTI